MKKYTRVMIAVILILGIVLLARNDPAWAQPASQNDLSVRSRGQAGMDLDKPEPGSVKPPPKKFSTCESGTYSVGGVVILTITDLKPGYCVEADLWNPRFQIKRLPDGVGAPLAHMLFLRIYYAGRLVHEIPAGDGIVEACYAIPPGKQGQFYFYDFFWERFNKQPDAPPEWDLIDTQVDADGKVACTSTQVTGVYGLMGN